MTVLAPTSVDDMCDALAGASAADTVVRVRGGGTRSRRGRPFEADLTVSTAGLSGVVAYEPADMTVTVWAGTTVDELLDELGRSRQGWPHADARPGSTVGGVLAAGASGLSRLRYGPVRDSLLEVVIVTGDGRRVTAGARTVKSVAGYDLPRLMVGADGTLGVIVQATIRLWPEPAAMRWYRAEGDLDDLVPLAERLVGDAARPLGVVLIPGAVWVLAEWDEPPAGLEEVEAAGPAQPSASGIVNVGVPPPAVPAALVQLEAGGYAYRAQAGVGTIEVAAEDAADVSALRAQARSLGGHAVVADGAPELRVDPIGPAPPALEIMRRLRGQFDPAGILNPGCVPWDPAA